MIYEFESARGERMTKEYPIGGAPKIGARVRIKGKWYRRIPSVGTQAQCLDYVCVDTALPKKRLARYRDGRMVETGVDPKTGVDHNEITQHYPRVDKAGRPVFRSKAELTSFFSRESVKRHGYLYDR